MLFLDVSLAPGMQGKCFEDIFDKSIFEKNTVVIDEDTSQNCDFLLLELVRTFGYAIFQWNDSGEFLKETLSKYNVNARVASIYDAVFDSEEILDDIYTQKRLGFEYISKINVFRSSTATTLDFYNYNLVVKISKLESGVSSKMDGTIKVFKRDHVYYDLKYKVFSDRIVYFE